MFLVSLIGPWKRSRHEACLETKLCSDLVGCFYGFIFGAGIFCVFIDPFFGTRFGPQNQVGDSSYMCYCRLLLFFSWNCFFLWVVVGCWQKTPVCMTLFLGPHMNPETGLKERPPRVPKQPPRAPRQQPGTPIQQPESPKQQQAPDLARWEQGHEDSDLGHKASYQSYQSYQSKPGRAR